MAKRDKVARGVEIGAGSVAGGVGATFGAAKLRDAYRQEHPERYLKQVGAVETMAPKAKGLAHTLAHGTPGFKPLFTATVAGVAAATASKYREHRERHALRAVQDGKPLIKSAFDVQYEPLVLWPKQKAKTVKTKGGQGAMRAVQRADAQVRQLRGELTPTSPQNIVTAVQEADDRVRTQLGKARYYDPERNRKRRGQVAGAGLLGAAGYAGARTGAKYDELRHERHLAGAHAKRSADSFRAAQTHDAGIEAQLKSMLRPVGTPANMGSKGSIRRRVEELAGMRSSERLRIVEGQAGHAASLRHANKASGALRSVRTRAAITGGLVAGAYGARRYAHSRDYRPYPPAGSGFSGNRRTVGMLNVSSY